MYVGRIVNSEYRDDGDTEMFRIVPTMWKLANGQAPVYHLQVCMLFVVCSLCFDIARVRSSPCMYIYIYIYISS